MLALRGLVLSVGLLPWALAALGARPAVMVQAFRPLCHQRADRTLEVLGIAMVDCSRCAGIHAGLALGAVLVLPRRWMPHGRSLMLVALALAVFDVVLQDLGWRPPWHATRLATGLAIGWSATAFMFASLQPATDHKKKRARPAKVEPATRSSGRR